MRVMVVDDNVDAAVTLSMLLEAAGHLPVRGPGGVRLAACGTRLHARRGHQAPGLGDPLPGRRQRCRGHFQATGGVAGVPLGTSASPANGWSSACS